MADGSTRGRHPTSATPPLIGLLLIATVAEVVLLGSGRLLQFGPLTARMLLFIFGVAFATLHALHRQRIDGEIAALGLAFGVVLVLGVELGLLHGALLPQVIEDIKPLTFFLSVFFFAAAITSVGDVRRVAAAIRRSSVALALGYLALLVAVVAGAIPFGTVYVALNASGEVFFRGANGFFYKGFLYLGVGIFFYAFGRGLRGKVAAGLLLAALVLTLTRGLILATVVVLAIAFVLRQRNALVSAAYVGVVATAAAIALPIAAAAFDDRSSSDAARLADVSVVLRATSGWNILLGHGLGIPIGERDRIEATYLEVLFQQGLVGIALWALLLAFVVRDYLGARRAGHADLAEPFFLGGLFVYLESATNPFLTNPIGMSMVLLALVSLRVLARNPQTEPLPGDDLGPRGLEAITH